MTKAAGEKIRREVMGDEFVDRALNNADDLTAPLQDYINTHAWGSTWQRDDLDRKTRSLVTLGMLVAQKATTEIKGHTRGLRFLTRWHTDYEAFRVN